MILKYETHFNSVCYNNNNNAVSKNCALSYVLENIVSLQNLLSHTTYKQFWKINLLSYICKNKSIRANISKC